MAFQTPYAYLVPPPSEEDRRALEANLRMGQHSPILVDEQGNILDGHNRYEILGESVTTHVVYGLTEAEKQALVVQSAVARRNMTPEQKAKLRESMKRLARELRAEDPKKHTQESIAEAFGVDRSLVAKWLIEPSFNTNVKSSNGVEAKPDARVKVAPDKRDEALDRFQSGESQSEIAQSLGVAPSTVSKWRSDAGVAPRRSAPKPRPESEAKKLAVLELHNEGFGTSEIARRLNMEPTSVSHWKAKLGVGENSPGVKLWSDVDHLTTLLEGTELKAAELVTRLEGSEFTSDPKEIKRCIRSLSQSKRTVSQLISALKRRLQ